MGLLVTCLSTIATRSSQTTEIRQDVRETKPYVVQIGSLFLQGFQKSNHLSATTDVLWIVETQYLNNLLGRNCPSLDLAVRVDSYCR